MKLIAGVPSNYLYDVCVIGSGPVGLASALALGEAGYSVLLVESGAANDQPHAQALSDAEVVNTKSHAPMANAVHRGLGGTSVWWGGRCVPLDDLDVLPRPHVVEARWPVSPDDISRYLDQANSFLGAGPAHFSVSTCRNLTSRHQPLSERMVDSTLLESTALERWSATPNMWLAHRDRVQRLPKITVLSEHTCVGFIHHAIDAPVTAILARPTSGGTTVYLHARAYVLAAGGVESARLVLNSFCEAGGLKVPEPDMVGRYYMGHPSGKIATIRLHGEARKTIYGFEKDGDVYVRRRLTLPSAVQKQHRLLNIAFWLDNPPLADASHGSGVLSSAYLGLSAPWIGPLMAPAAIRERMLGGKAVHRLPHIFNCLRTPLSTAGFVARFMYQRYLGSPRVPGFFVYSENNTYALHYHAEQSPNIDSRVTLSEEKDALGLCRAKIDLRWSQRDVDSIIRSHDVLAEALEEQGIGTLSYSCPRQKLNDAVIDEAVDGYHQIGTMRMGATPDEGVTDSFGRLYGTPNLYVAGSALFPTSGQANPTLTAVALAMRQAEELKRLLRK